MRSLSPGAEADVFWALGFNPRPFLRMAWWIATACGPLNDKIANKTLRAFSSSLTRRGANQRPPSPARGGPGRHSVLSLLSHGSPSLATSETAIKAFLTNQNIC